MDLCDLVWPFSCICCGKLGEILCKGCQSLLPNFVPEFCTGCKRITKPWNLCQKCKRGLSPIKQLFTLGDFQHTLLKKSVLEIKFNHQKKLLYPLGEKLAEKILKSRADFDCLIAVPISKISERERGYNQSQALAEILAKFTNKDCLSDIVIKIKTTIPQRSLPRRLREKNVIGAFQTQMPEKIKDKKVLLVDDVITTGATLKEIAKALKRVGAKKIIAATLAREF